MKKSIINKSLIIILIATIPIFFHSCTEKINLDLGGTYTRLVVDGAITSDTMSHIVKLSTTTDFYYDKPAPAVSGATVSISDGTNTFILAEDPQYPGVYKTQPDVYGVAGKKYTLTIHLNEAINGHADYQASSELPPVAPMDSITLEYKHEWKVLMINCYAQDPPRVDYYMFNIWKNNVKMTDTINKVATTDDRLFNGRYIDGVAIGFLRSEIAREKVNPGDTIKAQIAGITREYLYYIYDVQIESGYKNPLISGPPANIKGNINNGAIGFFAAYSTKYASRIAQ